MHELLAFQVWDTFRVAGMLMRHLMARNTIKILEPGQHRRVLCAARL